MHNECLRGRQFDVGAMGKTLAELSPESVKTNPSK